MIDSVRINWGYRDLPSKIKTSKKKTAVVLHLYYPDMWDLFRQHLKILEKNEYDFYISLPEGVYSNSLKGLDGAVFYNAPNRGRDVLPFLMVARELQKRGYESVLKLHSKKSPHMEGGDVWMQTMLESLVPRTEKALKSLEEVLADKNTGVVGPLGQYIALPVNYQANRKHLQKIIRKVFGKSQAELVDKNTWDYGFFAGTMFWARLDSISLILKAFRISDFEKEAGQIDGTFAHAVERAFCLMPELKGKKLYQFDGGKLTETAYKTKNVPEWSELYEG